MYRGQKIQRRKQLAITAALAAGLLASGASAGLFMATAPSTALSSAPTTVVKTPVTSTTPVASTPAPSTTTGATTTPSTSSSGSNATLISTTSLSKLIGEVVSSTPSTLVVKDQSGILHTIALSSSTTYSAHTGRVGRSAVGVRTIVFVQGTWNANHTVLRAQSVGVAGKVASGGDDSSGTDN